MLVRGDRPLLRDCVKRFILELPRSIRFAAVPDAGNFRGQHDKTTDVSAARQLYSTSVCSKRSKKWYEDLLGLHVYEYRPGWAAFLAADEEQSHEVALMQLGEDAPLQSKGQVGLNHMAWRLESLDDLKEFYKKIKAEGQPIDHVSDHGISLGIYLRDPDGNGVEVFYELPRVASGRSTTTYSLVREDRERSLPTAPGCRDRPRRSAGSAASHAAGRAAEVGLQGYGYRLLRQPVGVVLPPNRPGPAPCIVAVCLPPRSSPPPSRSARSRFSATGRSA